MSKEYIATGTITLTGVQFSIQPDNLEEAMALAAAGQFVASDETTASMANWEIDTDTVKENP